MEAGRLCEEPKFSSVTSLSVDCEPHAPSDLRLLFKKADVWDALQEFLST